MAELEATVRVPNSLLIIGEPSAKPPATMGGKVVAATSQCVAIGTLVEGDGATQVRLVSDDVDPSTTPKFLPFDGVLQLTSGRFTVENVVGQVYLEQSIPKGDLRVRVWVNHETEPDEILIAIG